MSVGGALTNPVVWWAFAWDPAASALRKQAVPSSTKTTHSGSSVQAAQQPAAVGVSTLDRMVAPADQPGTSVALQVGGGLGAAATVDTVDPSKAAVVMARSARGGMAGIGGKRRRLLRGQGPYH